MELSPTIYCGNSFKFNGVGWLGFGFAPQSIWLYHLQRGKPVRLYHLQRGKPVLSVVKSLIQNFKCILSAAFRVRMTKVTIQMFSLSNWFNRSSIHKLMVPHHVLGQPVPLHSCLFFFLPIISFILTYSCSISFNKAFFLLLMALGQHITPLAHFQFNREANAVD